MELLPQGLEAAPVPCAQAELGDVEAGGMGHVDHEGVGQDQQLILLGTEQQPLPSSAWWHPHITAHPQAPNARRCQEPRTHLRIQLHDVGDFVPAEADEPLVIPGAVSPHYNVRLEVWLPCHAVWHGGRPPFGVVRWGVAFWPHVVPMGRDGNGE